MARAYSQDLRDRVIDTALPTFSLNSLILADDKEKTQKSLTQRT